MHILIALHEELFPTPIILAAGTEEHLNKLADYNDDRLSEDEIDRRSDELEGLLQKAGIQTWRENSSDKLMFGCYRLFVLPVP